MANICLFTDFSFDSGENFSRRYDSVCKNLASFLYKNPKFQMVLHFDGESLEWLEKNHPEFIQIIGKLLDRKQIEILGGGFYNPILPVIFPMDRTGQIEKLTSELRRNMGKRPRGFYLFESCWSESLIPVIKNCGFEYVFLKTDIIPEKYKNSSPLISSFLGKTVSVLEMKEKNIDYSLSGENFFDEYSSGDEFLVLDLKFDHFDCDFFQKLNAENTRLPSNFLKSNLTFRKAYIPESDILDSIISSKRNSKLFNRMMYVSMLVNQWKGDKSRRSAVREQLWLTQNGKFYIENNCALIQSAYRNLSEAERYIREYSDFVENVTTFDYDGCGFNDYICLMNQFSAGISPCGGKVFELNAFKKSGNYADNDGIFQTFLFDDESFIKYKSGENSLFAFGDVIFRELKFEGLKKDVLLFSDDNFSSMELPVSLKKRYVANSNGFMVQFILKNESPIAFKGNLVVESNFSDMAFNSSDENYEIEVISNDEKKLVENITEFRELNGISYLQLKDSGCDISFVFEPNEDCDFISKPVISEGCNSFKTALCWKVDLSAGMEIEKTVNFSVFVPKKKKRN